MKKVLYLSLACVALVGCDNTPSQTYTPPPPPQPVIKKVEILSVKPPKHFHLKYKVLETGATYSVGSKRCDTWTNAVEGNTYMADITKSGCEFTKHLTETVNE